MILDKLRRTIPLSYGGAAYLLYRPYDLGLIMYNNTLVSVTVEDDPAEINLAVWDQQGDDPSCEDFNPYR